MHDDFAVRPLPQPIRRNVFVFLLALFIISLPFLFLYATGYRFDFGKAGPFVSTGGLYVAADRTGAEIYIDGELVRETRTFRKAFYAQGLEPGTHRVHVQKPGSHTWVKELPVYAHLVTEAQAFNLPLVPRVRVISPWKNDAGESVLFARFSLAATTTNPYVVATSTATRGLIPDTEYATLAQSFASSTDAATPRVQGQIQTIFTPTATDTKDVATTTKSFNGVTLFENNGDIFAAFTGPREQMPYYYCAKDFEVPNRPEDIDAEIPQASAGDEPLVGPVQSVPDDVPCDSTITIDRKDQTVHAFDFFPGSSDLVMMVLDDGIYVVEVDDRAWQNVQPLLLGQDLSLQIQNGSIYVYDGTLIYQVLLENS